MKVLFLKLNRWSAWGWRNLDIHSKFQVNRSAREYTLGYKIQNSKFLHLKKLLSKLDKCSDNIGYKNRNESICARRASGFTLLELVIVMAMIGIISSASFKLVRFSDTYRSLSIVVTELKGAIRTAQTLALAPPVMYDNSNIKTICGFGVRNNVATDASKLQIFYSYSVDGEVKDCRGITSVADACDGTINRCLPYELKSFEGFELTQSGNNDIGIFFRSPYGKVFGAGGVTVRQSGSSHVKTIEVNEYGKINIKIP